MELEEKQFNPISEINKEEKVNELIEEIARKTQGITTTQIAKAKEIYKYDTRSLEEIAQELITISHQITKEFLQKQRRKELAKEKENDVDKMEMPSIFQEEVLEPEFTFQDENIDFNNYNQPELLTDEFLEENNASLEDMFKEQEYQKEDVKENQKESGKVFVKTNNFSNNNAGFTNTKAIIYIIVGLLLVLSIVGLIILL